MNIDKYLFVSMIVDGEKLKRKWRPAVDSYQQKSNFTIFLSLQSQIDNILSMERSVIYANLIEVSRSLEAIIWETLDFAWKSMSFFFLISLQLIVWVLCCCLVSMETVLWFFNFY